MRMWFAVGVILLSATPAVAECEALAQEAAVTARQQYQQLGGRELDACSISRDVVSRLPGVLLRFQPHEVLPRERRHWQISCEETQTGAWRCDEPGITRTILVREPNDWAEVLGMLSNERAVQVAEFAAAHAERGLTYEERGSVTKLRRAQLNDIDFIIGGGEFIVGFAVRQSEDVCLQIAPRAATFEVLLVFDCNGSEPAA
jgi:hypothetical protein